ncbi:MAG: hypothetical protein ACLPI9_00835 [Halobacteriota archaeon]
MSPFWKKEKKSDAENIAEMQRASPPAAEEKTEASQPEITVKPAEAEAEVKEMAAAKPKVLTAVMSGCTGCLISLTDNYDILLDLLDAIDYRYETTLADVREIPDDQMDIAIVHGSICLQDKRQVDDIRKIRQNSTFLGRPGRSKTGLPSRRRAGHSLPADPRESVPAPAAASRSPPGP